MAGALIFLAMASMKLVVGNGIALVLKNASHQPCRVRLSLLRPSNTAFAGVISGAALALAYDATSLPFCFMGNASVRRRRAYRLCRRNETDYRHGHAIRWLGRLGSRQNGGARLGNEQRASLSQPDAAADAMEEFYAPGCPSSAAIEGAYRRLGDIERLGGARDMAGVRRRRRRHEAVRASYFSSTLSGYRRRRLYMKTASRLPESPFLAAPGSSHRDSLCAPWSARVMTAAEGGIRLVRQVCEIVDNRRDVLRVDWPLVRIPHLLDLGLPDGSG